MQTYPNLILTLRGRDLREIAVAAGVSVDTIEALVATGGLSASLDVRARLAAALDVPPSWLFQLLPEVEDAVSQAPSRYVTDPETLRVIEALRRSPR